MCTVPKIIHQVWIGPNKMPKIWMDSFKKEYINKFPDWEYKIWTEKELDELNMININIYNTEKSYHGKCDIARYEILYQFGGVYIDADSYWVNDKPLNDFFPLINNTGLLFAYEDQNKKLIANGVIFCSKNNDIMLDIINELGKRYVTVQHKDVWKISGPGLITNMFNKNQNFTVIDHYYFYPTHWRNNQIDIEYHKKIKLDQRAYLFQYGYSTKNFANVMNNFMETKYEK